MIYHLPDVRDADVENKKVFLLSDLDVPLAQQSTVNHQQTTIRDDARLRVGLQTVQYLLDNNATVIIGGKLGRPEGRVDETLSLKPVGEWYIRKLKIENFELRIEETMIGQFSGWRFNEKLFLLENLRFYPGEEKNDSDFAQKLASLTDLYVNDAFDLCHRIEASVAQVPYHLPHFAGLRLIEEVESLQEVLVHPQRPLVVIIGGAKIETKLPLVTKILDFADFVLVGGKIAQEKERLEEIPLEKRGQLLIAESAVSKNDISEKSILEFTKVMQKAGTILWNGPMGITQPSTINHQQSTNEDMENGTREIVNTIIQSSAYKVAGGGDTVEFINKMGVFAKFDFVSMGGGAMLTFISGESLPGLEALIS